MNKRKLLIIPILTLSLSFTLQACGSNSKVTTNTQAETTQKTSVNEDKPIEKKESIFSSYKELTTFGKEKTGKVAELMKKHNIPNTITEDNLYVVTTEKSYNKYDTDYIYHMEYFVNPNFETGHGTGLGTLYYEKHIEDKFDANDDKIKLVNDMVNSYLPESENINIDDFINKLNDADEKAKTSKRYTSDLDKNHSVFLEINYSGNKTQLLMRYADRFENFKFDVSRKDIFNTVKEFKDDKERSEQMRKMVKDNGFNGLQSLTENNKESKDVLEVGYSANTGEYTKDSINTHYNISAKVFSYNRNDLHENLTLKTIYKIIKTYTLNDYLTEEEFENYISSYLTYHDYSYFINLDSLTEDYSDNEKGYYDIFTNIRKDGYPYTISYTNGTVGKELFYFEFKLDCFINAIAEGKTKL